MRFTVIVLHLSILVIGLAQAEDFICPTCAASGLNAQEKCESNLAYPVCEFTEQPQCIVYKHDSGLFTRICTSESIYQQEFEKCNQDPGCQMGRCFSSGCLATLDFICPTCAASGSNAKEKCESNFAYPVCEYTEQPQCIVYKHDAGMFTRICTSESIYQQEFEKCNPDPCCQMGRCFTSGCLATLGEN